MRRSVIADNLMRLLEREMGEAGGGGPAAGPAALAELADDPLALSAVGRRRLSADAGASRARPLLLSPARRGRAAGALLPARRRGRSAEGSSPARRSWPIKRLLRNAPLGGVVECAICLDKLREEGSDELEADGSELALTACNHVFHSKCLVNWQVSGGSTCPVCRADFSAASPPERRRSLQQQSEGGDGGLRRLSPASPRRRIGRQRRRSASPRSGRGEAGPEPEPEPALVSVPPPPNETPMSPGYGRLGFGGSLLPGSHSRGGWSRRFDSGISVQSEDSDNSAAQFGQGVGASLGSADAIIRAAGAGA